MSQILLHFRFLSGKNTGQ